MKTLPHISAAVCHRLAASSSTATCPVMTEAMTEAPTMAPTVAVVVQYTIMNLDYAKVNNNATLKNEIVSAVKTGTHRCGSSS